MIDDTTEAGMRCQCGHFALAHINPSPDDERCSASGCDCVEFVNRDVGRVSHATPQELTIRRVETQEGRIVPESRMKRRTRAKRKTRKVRDGDSK